MSDHRPLTSVKRAKGLSTALFLMSMATLIFTDQMWPGVMLAIGLPLALRQYLLGRHYDATVSLLVFGGTFITLEFAMSWQVFLPVIFTLGALFILFREFAGPDETTEEEKEDNLNHEIEEEKP